MLRFPVRGAGILLALLLAVDPARTAVLDLAVATGNGDAEESSSGSVAVGSSDLELVLDGSLQTVGLRFTGVAIPRSYVVTAAWLQFRTDETGSTATSLTIQAEAAANAAAFSSATGSISARPRTAEAAGWSPPAWSSTGEAGPAQRSPDLAPLLQALVDRPDWASGNAVALILTGTGKRVADSQEGGFGPRLHVEFEPPDDFPPELALTSPASADAFVAGDPISFVASASDVEDGDLAAAVSFTSDRDGGLGAGPTLVRSDLSPGIHQISASVTDSGGTTVSQTVQILVSAGTAQVLAAGDIASCTDPTDEATAALLDGLDGLVLTLGDNAYPDGSSQDFADCYEPSWGRHKARTRPAVGNHEYESTAAAPYFAYFGAAAGDPDEGWYSFDYGGWHFVALNSNCAAIGGCGRASPQGVWLEADLDAHPSRCTLAYWHHARFSSGDHGSNAVTRELWAILQEHAADLVLVGHDHVYERFAPQNADGLADPLGMRQLVVGTGGRSLVPFASSAPNREAANDETFGVLALDLTPDAYAWQFHPVAGQSFTDGGVASCVAFAPELSISAPADGTSVAWGTPVAFAGAASDVEEGDLGASLVWSSSRDGVLGTGSAFTRTDLSCGTHLVTASVTDLHGGSAQETLTLDVGPAGCASGPPGGCGLGPELLVLLPLLGASASRLASASRGRLASASRTGASPRR